MIIFLDFDGVCHTIPSENGFDKLPLLEAFLFRDDYKYINIVISSSWRFEESLEQIKLHFVENLRYRVIGVTPDLFRKWGYRKDRATRWHEIELWMKENDYNGNWVAIDDDVENFPENCQNLIICDA